MDDLANRESVYNWRIIYHPKATGSWNMAVDEAILESVVQGHSLPTLRLYSWDPPCLSLGYAQPSKDLDSSSLTANNWHVVRRPTGGRAILHTDEITYSVIARQENFLMAGGVLESYCRLSAALLNALLILGLDARADRTYPNAPDSSAVCFETPSNYEITAQGKKLIGSAQARRNGGVLQHGSLPLTGDLTRITRALSFDNEAQREEAASRLLAHATTLQTVFGREITWDSAADAFEKAFSQTFGIKFTHGNVSDLEQKHARQLVTEKYAHPNWTFRI